MLSIIDLEEMLQARILEVYFLHDWVHPDAEKQAQYELIQARFPGGIRHLEIDDPDADWAVSKKREATEARSDEHGHEAL